MLFEQNEIYNDHSAAAQDSFIQKGHPGDLQEHLSGPVNGPAETADVQSQFAGLQAIADAAIVNTTESVLDPALFEAPKTPTPMDPHLNVNGAKVFPTAHSISQSIEQDDALEHMDLDHDQHTNEDQVEPVTVEELQVKDVGKIIVPAEKHEILENAVQDGVALPRTEVEPSKLMISASQHQDMGASHPHEFAPQGPGMELPAPQTPEPHPSELHTAEAMDIDTPLQASPPTSALSEPPTSPVVAATTTNTELLDTAEEPVLVEASLVVEETVVDEVSEMGKKPAVTEEAPVSSDMTIVAKAEQSLSRASSILSDAPSEHASNAIDLKAERTTKKRKGPFPRNSKAPNTAIETAKEVLPAKRHSSRHSKPIERLSTQQHAELESLSNKKGKRQAPVSILNGHSPSKSTSPEVGRLKQTRAKTPATTPVKIPAKAVGRRKSVKPEVMPENEIAEHASSPTMETEEEMNRRIALQIHQEGLGLRRRSRGS
jgi:hypothetical protein